MDLGYLAPRSLVSVVYFSYEEYSPDAKDWGAHHNFLNMEMFFVPVFRAVFFV